MDNYTLLTDILNCFRSVSVKTEANQQPKKIVVSAVQVAISTLPDGWYCYYGHGIPLFLPNESRFVVLYKSKSYARSQGVLDFMYISPYKLMSDCEAKRTCIISSDGDWVMLDDILTELQEV